MIQNGNLFDSSVRNARANLQICQYRSEDDYRATLFTDIRKLILKIAPKIDFPTLIVFK